jgi:carbamoyltransferase
MYILGIWDGHDAGAALLEDNKIIFASNEERYTKRKLEIKFPHNSIAAALSYANLKPSDIEEVAFPTAEFAKTASRLLPYQQEVYYRFRRRKMALRPRTHSLRRFMKTFQTSIGVMPPFVALSKAVISGHLKHMGFQRFRLHYVDHHTSHAATAAFASGLDRALVITLDGLGDGLSGSVSTLSKKKLERKHAISARNSLGIFFEQVTNIVGMRELEDEGKVMAMACYSYPFPFEENKLKDFFRVEGVNIIAKYSHLKQYDLLERMAWAMPREQFAYMAQQLLEHVLTEFVSNAIEEYGIGDVAMAGGIFSNVKANMQVRNLRSLKKWFIFPHMGDGGTALGAAMHVNYVLNGVSKYIFADSYLGDEFSSDYIKKLLKKEKGISFERESDKSAHAAELIAKDNYVFWYQGRMEYGPRALGNRSILAAAGSESVKEKLNLYVKQREWYQPFAPSMLAGEAKRLLEEVKGEDKFMTMAYRVKEDKKDVMRSVVHVDNTARPQMVRDENKSYRRLLEKVRRGSGYGVVLNTSFNIHGMPIVMSPEDALLTMKKTKTRHMFLGDFYVENEGA